MAAERVGTVMATDQALSAESAIGRQTVQAHWHTLQSAAKVLGVSEIAVRKRVADGQLTSIRAGRSRRVLLVGDSPAVGNQRPPTRVDQRAESEVLLARTSESLSGLVRDLQRQSLALAAQIGYLQHQLAEAQDSVRALSQRRDATVDAVAEESVSSAEHEAALREISNLRAALAEAEAGPAPPARRRWWWRR